MLLHAWYYAPHFYCCSLRYRVAVCGVRGGAIIDVIEWVCITIYNNVFLQTALLGVQIASLECCCDTEHYEYKV